MSESDNQHEDKDQSAIEASQRQKPPPPPSREPIRTLPKRFYKEVSLSPQRTLLLDGREVKTPLCNSLKLPTPELAEAVAEEWRAQEKFINLSQMTLTKLANTAQDKAEPEREKILDEIAAYGLSDMTLYRSQNPKDLEARQQALWDPVVEWANQTLKTNFEKTASLNHKQPEAGRAALKAHIAGLDAYHLTALYALTTLIGSSLLSLMLLEGKITPDEAWAAANLEENWQTAHWGQDEEAAQRRRQRGKEFQGIVNFLAAL